MTPPSATGTRSPPNQKYNVTVVTGQYDGYSDFPIARTRPPSPTRLPAPSWFIPSMLTPLSSVPASNVTVRTNAKGGVTTSYLVPTKTLPW